MMLNSISQIEDHPLNNFQPQVQQDVISNSTSKDHKLFGGPQNSMVTPPHHSIKFQGPESVDNCSAPGKVQTNQARHTGSR